jgi:hypothetical protein
MISWRTQTTLRTCRFAKEYLYSAKRAILKASQESERRLASSAAASAYRNCHPPPVTHSVKLPPLKLEPFAGDVETWARFWEQFESFIDQDPTLSINKHAFLRGYLEGE